MYAEAKKAGNETEAKEIMQMTFDYNEDDCLSTKLLAELLQSISWITRAQRPLEAIQVQHRCGLQNTKWDNKP